MIAAIDATTSNAAFARIVELEAALAALTAERDRLREAYQQVLLELELMRRRLFVAKAERIDTAQLELEFAGKLAALDALNYLELAPKYWRTTRAGLEDAQLKRELGPLTIPYPASSSEQPAAR